MSPGTPGPCGIHCNIDVRIWSNPSQENKEEKVEYSQQSKYVTCYWATVRDESIQSSFHR